MSSETSISDDVSASPVSHSFRLKWKIPLQKLFHDGRPPRPLPKSLNPPQIDDLYNVVENSKLIEFKNLKMYPFSLVLLKQRYDWTYHLKLVTNATSDGAKLEYAFVCIDERLFQVGVFDKIAPTYIKDQELTNSKFDTNIDHIEIVCGISAVSGVTHSPPTEGDSDDSESLLYECSLPWNVPALGRSSWSASTSSTGSEAFAKYSMGGVLPSLNVPLAKDLLIHIVSSKRDCPELKALSVEYLTRNLDPENVVGVLRMACDHREEYLLSKCYDFLSDSCKVVHK